MKRSLRAAGPTRLGKPQPVGEVLEDIRKTLPAQIATRQAGRFSAAYTLEEIAQSLETLAGRCEAEAQRLPARATSLLQMAGLARISARELRAERLYG